ncbi:MAG: flavodoxin [Ignavibacteria bacterium]|jgi:flavodoxin
MNKKSIIIYYSWSGNTKTISGLIKEKIGSNLFEINPVNAYSDTYSICLDQAKKEKRDGFTPELKEYPNDLDSYDYIFIGTPIWWHTMVPPLFTFLKNTDLSGKIIVPFCTHGGGGKGTFINDLRNLCKGSNVLKYLELFGSGGSSVAAEISAWLNIIGITNN